MANIFLMIVVAFSVIVLNVFKLFPKILHVVFQSSVILFSSFWLKDQLPKCLNSMLPYKFRCNSCNVHIGKTKQ